MTTSEKIKAIQHCCGVVAAAIVRHLVDQGHKIVIHDVDLGCHGFGVNIDGQILVWKDGACVPISAVNCLPRSFDFASPTLLEDVEAAFLKKFELTCTPR